MMEYGFAAIPQEARYHLRNANVPRNLLTDDELPDTDGLARVDITVAGGKVEAIHLCGPVVDQAPSVDLKGGIVFPCFVDVHTHLDKGHIVQRQSNPDGALRAALDRTAIDRAANWSAHDVARRMDFSLRCAFAHGTAALRTHIDSASPQGEISWPVFEQVRRKWKGLIELQAVALAGIDDLLNATYLSQISRRLAGSGGAIGGALVLHPLMRPAIKAVIASASEFGLDIDLHLDETVDPRSDALRILAEEVLESGFSGHVAAGHCCSLAHQDPEEARRTIELVAEAGIAVVTLPLCNMSLQERSPGRTPLYRGITSVQELTGSGVCVAAASDNTRDPFYAYGDLDPLEVMRETIRIAHLDHPIDIAPAMVTSHPARMMSLEGRGQLSIGMAADLVLFQGRSWSELLSRPESHRTVLRSGRPIDRTLPNYYELDDLMEET